MKRIFAILLIASSLAACNNKYKNAQTDAVDAVRIMRDSLKLDSFQRAETEKKVEAEAQAKAVAARPVINNYNTTSGSTTTTQRKTGMSSAAKGAIIGGAAGAVGGVLIDKKDGRGAIIGGVAGAGAGYLIGRDKDKKTGRAQ
jgi:hypothetical protein